MQVLDDEYDQAVRGEALQDAGGELEQARHVVVPVVDGRHAARVRQDPGEELLMARARRAHLVGQSLPQHAQGLGERGEGQAVAAEFDAATDRRDGRPRLQRPQELPDQPRLAHPGLAPDEDGLGVAAVRGPGGPQQLGQFGLAAHEDGADAGLYREEALIRGDLWGPVGGDHREPGRRAPVVVMRTILAEG